MARRESFTVETTLSGLSYARSVQQWRADGYSVTLIFLSLPDVDTAIARVAERVRQGGHDIPIPVIRRRFEAGFRNFEIVFKPLVDEWLLIDNAGDAPVLLDRSTP